MASPEACTHVACWAESVESDGLCVDTMSPASVYQSSVPFYFSALFVKASQIFQLLMTEIPRASLSRKVCIKGCQVLHRISGKDHELGRHIEKPEVECSS